MILHVPGQAVDLVDDNGLDVAVLGDPGQHRPEPRPVGRTGRLALVHVLVDQLPAFVADAPDACPRWAAMENPSSVRSFSASSLLETRR